ncbi:MAG TPA: hypothetical protein VF584_04010 [Longimicrobium sp.]|jgi:hypothetical protein
MKARTLTLAALCALAAACGGGEQEPKAGDSLDPGPTGTIESTGPQTGTGTPADTATATDASTAGGATATPSTATNAPPAMTSGATEGDTTKSH